MPQLTLSAVAKLYGMHRTTLYAAIKAGRVSAGHNLRGQKVIELSEAIRAWGEPSSQPPVDSTHSTPANTGHSTHSTQPVELMTEATALRLAAAMERLIEIEEAKLLLLEHKPAPSIEHQPATRPQSFADLLASFD
jgi:predicted DNA-binding transcriptional regulator AlpA